MCLITTKRKVKVAEEDIQVWKLFRKGNVSPYRRFKYEVGKLYKAKLTPVNCYEKMIPHFDNETGTWLRKLQYYHNREDFIGIEEGFHAAINKERLQRVIDYNESHFNDYSSNIKPEENFIGECVIPKGSEYYEDGTECIVSNQIKLI